MIDIIVIGGGAAGMVSAITAKRQGKDVFLLERNDRLGKKLLATGNGRCNYTNKFLSIDNFYSNNPKFPIGIVSKFDQEKTIEFFEQLGVHPYVEKAGKVFPKSLQSSSVLEVLKQELEYLNVGIKYNTLVEKIEKEKSYFKIYTENKIYKARKVILATGGKALPDSGSDGVGYDLAKSFGHSITHIYPGLVQLKLAGNVFKPLSGVKILGQASIYVDEEIKKSDKGDILFTDYGISGPPILQLSRIANKALLEEKHVEIKINTLCEEDYVEVLSYLYYRLGILGRKSVEDSLVGLINQKLIKPILEEVGIDKNKLAANLTSEEIENLCKILIDWPFQVIGSQSFKFAQVTVGGVDTREIDSRNLQSKLVEGLYIVGELLDVDGDCGGYNLQWAWATGYIAGMDASRS